MTLKMGKYLDLPRHVLPYRYASQSAYTRATVIRSIPIVESRALSAPVF